MENNIHSIINRIEKLKASGFNDNKENWIGRKANLGKIGKSTETVHMKP